MNFTGLLIFTVFTLTLLTMGAYTIVAPWWLHRAGRAYMALFASLTLLTGSFMFEYAQGEMPDWIQGIFVLLVAFAIAWNLYVIVSKQVRAWHNEHPEHHTPEGL